MDGLISILIIIAVAAISSSRKQKKQMQEKAKRMRAFKEAAEAEPSGKPARSREKMLEDLRNMGSEGSLHDHPGRKIAEHMLQKADIPAKEPVQMKMDIPAEKPASAPLLRPALKRQPAPVLFMDHDEPEGTVSTQGESAAEHALHRQKILAEEDKIRLEHEELQEIRKLNLKKLRTAVVMSEILDKPVSLRRRTY